MSMAVILPLGFFDGSGLTRAKVKQQVYKRNGRCGGTREPAEVLDGRVFAGVGWPGARVKNRNRCHTTAGFWAAAAVICRGNGEAAIVGAALAGWRRFCGRQTGIRERE